MQAIILTEEQAAAIDQANLDSGSNIQLKPRRLQDGRLILNADILTDPHFSDPKNPWAKVLGLVDKNDAPEEKTNQSEQILTTEPLARVGAQTLEARSTPALASLTDADLAE